MVGRGAAIAKGPCGALDIGTYLVPGNCEEHGGRRLPETGRPRCDAPLDVKQQCGGREGPSKP